LRQACKTGRINQVSIVVERDRARKNLARAHSRPDGARLCRRVPGQTTKVCFLKNTQSPSPQNSTEFCWIHSGAHKVNACNRRHLCDETLNLKNDSASPVRLFRTSSQAWTPRDRGRSDNFRLPFGSGRRHAFGAGLRAATATLNEQRRSGAQASAV